MTDSEETKAEETGTRESEGELQPLDVYLALRAAFHQMAAVAWQMMGLQADPFTGKMNKDIEQARVAIDTAAFLLEKLQPKLQGQEARDYQNLLTDLRMNFVRQAGA